MNVQSALLDISLVSNLFYYYQYCTEWNMYGIARNYIRCNSFEYCKFVGAAPSTLPCNWNSRWTHDRIGNDVCCRLHNAQTDWHWDGMIHLFWLRIDWIMSIIWHVDWKANLCHRLEIKRNNNYRYQQLKSNLCPFAPSGLGTDILKKNSFLHAVYLANTVFNQSDVWNIWV